MDEKRLAHPNRLCRPGSVGILAFLKMKLEETDYEKTRLEIDSQLSGKPGSKTNEGNLRVGFIYSSSSHCREIDECNGTAVAEAEWSYTTTGYL